MSIFTPDWPLPNGVRAASTLRTGGVSEAPWDSFNLALHVGDDQAKVTQNRQQLIQLAELPAEPCWLQQVHGTNVKKIPSCMLDNCADASWTATAGTVCAVMTADCLPVLFCRLDGKQVAAAHAGWRGLQAGVLEQTIAQFDGPAQLIKAWLGPAIGPSAFEVGEEVRTAFIQQDRGATRYFKPHGERYLANLAGLAARRLHNAGITDITHSNCCTYREHSRFFSYRREGITGRMASLIWITGE